VASIHAFGCFEVHGVVLCEKISCCIILIELKGVG